MTNMVCSLNVFHSGSTVSKLKNVFLAFSTTILLSISARAQQDTTSQLLTGPAGWSFERFSLPPSFAPGISYSGAEELRFSPGMFKKEATDYFTYAFVAQLNDTKNISQDNIKNYLLDYFKGLCSSTAHGRKLVIDTSKITVSVEAKKGTTQNEIIYNAWLNVFGVFADGAAVKLNMEIKVLNDAASSKTYLVFIVSPKEKTDEVWTQLYKIQKDFTIPAN